MCIQKREVIVAKQAKKYLMELFPTYKDKDNSEYLKEDFIHFLNGFPVFISQNGLLQALSFIRDKEEELYRVFEKYLKVINLLQSTINLENINEYIILQNRAIEFAAWIKRLANALYKNPKSKDKME